ncbi:RNA polymerase-associated protein RapA [Planctomycetales bacterium 10988]|nr:RNA polymerase-associated protein RapA [Planctomycetales bacterium 10988]
MSLANRCTQSFPAEIQSKGQELLNNHRTILGDCTSEYFETRIQLGRQEVYNVWLEWRLEPQQNVCLEVCCTCAKFVEELVLCEHVWAALLIADREGWDGYVPGYSTVRVKHAYVEDEVPEEDDGDDEDDSQEAFLNAMTTSMGVASELPQGPEWEQRLHSIRQLSAVDVGQELHGELLQTSKNRQAWYFLNLEDSRQRGEVMIDLFHRETRKNGQFGKIKALKLAPEELEQFSDPEDQELLSLLLGNIPEYEDQDSYPYRNANEQKVTKALLRSAMTDFIMPRLCGTGRFGWTDDRTPDTFRALEWDNGEPWRLGLEVQHHEEEDRWQLWGYLQRGAERMDLADPVLLLKDGLAIMKTTVSRLEVGSSFGWIVHLRSQGPIAVPRDQQDHLLESLWRMPALPSVDLPDELRWNCQRFKPRPKVMLVQAGPTDHRTLGATVAFDYGGEVVPWRGLEAAVVDRDKRQVLQRDREAERKSIETLTQLGFTIPQERYRREKFDFLLSVELLPEVVRQLVPTDWIVETDGHEIRQAGDVSLSVSSVIDWFELDGKVDFGGVQASMPALLEAAERGDTLLTLEDGSRGMLPESWLQQYASLVRLGKVDGDKLKFSKSQAAILDALLAAQPHVNIDEKFQEIREQLRSFEGVKCADEPKGFLGSLRHYQQEGLGWLLFLQRFRFGGCLADDMGLGKTVQVLALLQQHYSNLKEDQKRRPSLVIVPRSLVHNWIEEAGQFVPELRVLDYTGTGRIPLIEQFAECDLIITTYGTLRRDIMDLQKLEFEYTILDEAQAIKNSGSQASKACRLINSQYHLALTGTPVENHLGELWSIFEFLNPGMLGRASQRKLLSQAGNKGEPVDERSLQLLAKALRPFLLRRTKEQVLSELPEKTEQTLYCELGTEQRKHYDSLRAHYRTALGKQIGEVGIERSKIQVLEALLRLRQVACHPGLIDPDLRHESSAKLETLHEQLRSILEEGHKALIFSQFTSLLSIVRDQLDREGVTYAYLDGRTRKRKEQVDWFQNDPDCRVFLISLKAGGQGLNLTAADYVFILDPWWNPAVEAQAVDRAHRIGQTRRVFAYRLIARNTVEEKILQLQSDKRRLAEAIITADNSLIAKLTSDDLQLLLS